jgi:gamma-glutamyltranspeptidase/glutathione hydrolase
MLCRPELLGTAGAISSTHWLASAAGMAMFERGGNAFDAATAAALVLQVIAPHLNGLGGDVPIIVHHGRTGQVKIVCGQGPMPGAATIEHFRALGLAAIPGSGLLAACVPGVFGAWMRVLQAYGRLRLAEVVGPAIGYAEGGYPLPARAAGVIEALAPLFRNEWSESGRTYLEHGAAPAAGARVRNPALANTFLRLVAQACALTADRDGQIEAAVAAFYQGFVADAIDRFVRTAAPLDATGRRNRGLLTGHDLASWRAGIEDPVTLDYRGYQVHKPGPWSQGPVFLQQLALLEGFDLAAMGEGSADYIHTVVEVAKLAFADREAWYGDPAHGDVPIDALRDRRYTEARRALIGPMASGVLRPGTIGGVPGWIPPLPVTGPASRTPAWRAQLDSGLPGVLRLTEARGDTCCVTASDVDGNLVVATPSGGWLKSSPVVPGLGFPLGTRGQMAWLTPGHANSLAPGKRPRTTPSPTLVVREGRPYLAFGTPGGDRQDQWALRFFLQHVEHGLSVQAAAEALTFHTDHLVTSFMPRRVHPRSLVIEHGVDPAVLAELRRRGHEIAEVDACSLGMVCATGLAAGGVIAAASQRGGEAYAVVR